MDRHSCYDCGKGIKSLSSLSHYRTKCPVLLGQKKRVVLKIYQHNSAGETSIESMEDSPESQMFHVIQLHSCRPKGNEESYKEEDGNWIDINEDTNSSYASVPQMQSKLLTTTSAKIKLYEEVTGKSASQIFDDLEHIYHTRKPKTKLAQIQMYHPFRSETDFAAAQWFLSTSCTKGDIDRFFGDKPYGIHNDIWNVTDIQVEQEIIGLLPSTYQIRYRNIKSVLEFLMGHEPFEYYLSYTPVRQFSSTGSDNWIYDEMHTGDWW
jgi:hypothetical protein